VWAALQVLRDTGVLLAPAVSIGGAVLESVRVGLEYRKAIGLVGAAVSDHPGIDEIARRIVGLGARLSVSSLRADSVSDTLLHALARSGAKSLTIAPEAGASDCARP